MKSGLIRIRLEIRLIRIRVLELAAANREAAASSSPSSAPPQFRHAFDEEEVIRSFVFLILCAAAFN